MYFYKGTIMFLAAVGVVTNMVDQDTSEPVLHTDTSLDKVDTYLERWFHCDWFVIHQLGNTADPKMKIMQKLAKKLQARL